jgi:hypothetical protein
MMTDEQKLTLLLGVLKTYAEQKHCYNKYGDDFNPNDYTNGDVAFEVGADYGEITFARTLLEQIGVEYEHPVMKEND